ncbi:MAG TPA: ABC transporter ATP-binding protein [Erysipelotrichaceae bacterium]|nr:ABC transporter ATP-binding protein [Erysipelotrichaceae bacterium]
MIALDNISKKYKDNIIFEHVNVSFPANSACHIKGTNGSGKSVLMKMIAGYSLPDEGAVTADGIRIGIDRDFLPDAGVMINTPDFIRNENGFENLKELAAMRKKCTAEDILKYAHILCFENDIHKKYRTYSTGMKQKLRLIQALMEKPKYLLLDEPFDGLDTEAKNIVKKLLEDYLIIEGNTLIYTNHEEDISLENETVYVIRNHQILTE